MLDEFRHGKAMMGHIAATSTGYLNLVRGAIVASYIVTLQFGLERAASICCEKSGSAASDDRNFKSGMSDSSCSLIKLTLFDSSLWCFQEVV